MADLTYDGVRRATGEALVSLYSSMKELRGNLQSMRFDFRSDELRTRVTNIERQLNELAPLLQRMEITMQKLNQHGYAQAQWREQFNVQQLEQRIMNIEQFSGNLSRYLYELQQHLARLAEAQGQRIQS